MQNPPPVVSIKDIRTTIQAKISGIDEWIRFFDAEIARLEQQGASTAEIDEVKEHKAKVQVSREKLAAMDVFVPTMCCDQFMNCPPGN